MKAARSARAIKSAPKSAPKPAPSAADQPATAAETTATQTPARTATRPEPIFVKETENEAPDGGELKKKELIDKVVSRSDVKKKYAKPVIEAMLEILGEAVNEGRELNLQPFGKLKHNRTKETDNAHVAIVKIRQSKAQIDPLVEKTDDD